MRTIAKMRVIRLPSNGIDLRGDIRSAWIMTGYGGRRLLLVNEYMESQGGVRALPKMMYYCYLKF